MLSYIYKTTLLPIDRTHCCGRTLNLAALGPGIRSAAARGPADGVLGRGAQRGDAGAQHHHRRETACRTPEEVSGLTAWGGHHAALLAARPLRHIATFCNYVFTFLCAGCARRDKSCDVKSTQGPPECGDAVCCDVTPPVLVSKDKVLLF